MDWKNLSFHRIHCFSFLILFCLFDGMTSQDDQFSAGLPTVTVRGFLNFKTTVDGTVIVFTPVSEIERPSAAPKIATTSSEIFRSSASVMDKNYFNSNEGLDEDVSFASPPQNSIAPLKTLTTIANMVENKLKESFLPHISDNAVLPPAPYLTNNDYDKIKKHISSSNQFPTGLVTVLDDTSTDGSSATIHETKVIGTYIDGKYAQILQSSSRVLLKSEYELTTPHIVSYSTVDRSHSVTPVPKVNALPENIAVPSSTDADSMSVSLKDTKSVDATKSSSTVSSPFPLLTSPSIESTTVSPLIISVVTELPFSTISNSKIIGHELSTASTVQPPEGLPKASSSSNLFASQIENLPESELLPSSVLLRSSFDLMSSPSPMSPTETIETAKDNIRITTSQQPVISNTLSEDDNMVSTTTNNYRNATTIRTRFLSPRRPSQTVRLNRFKVKLTLRQDSQDDENVTFSSDDEDLDEEQMREDELESEMLIDPAKVVFQETTITSQVTLHVGRRKSIRILTITTSVPLTVHPTDMSESSLEDEDTDPYHHVETRTFTSTERALKTSIVPVYDGKTTSYHKVTESFFIMKYITAYRTLPIGEVTLLDSVLDESDAATLDAAANIQPSITHSAPPEEFSTLQPSIALATTGIHRPQLSNPFLSLGHALSNNPLAAVYLGLQQLNAHMTLYSTITDTSTYVTTETFYSTKTARFYDGRANKFRTVSEPTSTKKITLTTTVTSLKPYLNTQALQQQQNLQQFIAPTRQEPQFNTITSTYTTVSTVTSSSTRIYTLIYNGFSTKFRTVTSTSTYPTTVVVTSTTKVHLMATAAPFVYPYSS